MLLVTAHPDDESLFFGPTIQTLRRMGAQVHILCLSNGGAEGLGARRTKELEDVSSYLGITSLKVVDDPFLRDGFKESWPMEVTALHVEESVRRCRADVVLTFDEGGVSGHPNHTATYRGVLFWMSNSEIEDTAASDENDAASWTKLNQGSMSLLNSVTRKQKRSNSKLQTQVWVLVSTNVVRKFLMMADVFVSFFLLERSNAHLAASNPTQLVRAMRMHKSQWVWYRKLFILFSRYSYVNTLRPLGNRAL